MASIESITNDERLGEVAMDLLLDKSSKQRLLITNRARWLKTTLKGNAIYSNKHVELDNYLKDIARQYNNQIYKGYNAKVVLLRDPTSESATNVESIRLLLRAGVDVRYSKLKTTNYRIIISGKKLFFSYCNSDNEEHVVNRGFYYVGTSVSDIEDPLIEYYEREFNKLFDKSIVISLNKNDKIIFRDNFLRRVINENKEISIKEYILLYGGAVLGTILGAFVSFLMQK